MTGDWIARINKIDHQFGRNGNWDVRTCNVRLEDSWRIEKKNDEEQFFMIKHLLILGGHKIKFDAISDR